MQIRKYQILCNYLSMVCFLHIILIQMCALFFRIFKGNLYPKVSRKWKSIPVLPPSYILKIFFFTSSIIILSIIFSVGNLHAAGTGTLTISAGGNSPGYSIVSNGTQQVEMLLVKFVVSTNENIKINSIKFYASGTGHDQNEVESSSVKLYIDTGNGTYDGTEFPIGGNKTWDDNDGSVTFSFPSQTLTAGTTNYWLLICSFETNVTSGGSFRAYLDVNGDINAEGVTSEDTIIPTGAPIHGATINVDDDLAPPDFMPGDPFADPNPASTATTITLRVAVDESAFGGNVIREYNDFSQGTASDSNLNYTSGSLFLNVTGVTAGNPAIDRTNNTTQGNNKEKTYVDLNNPVTINGNLNRWEVYVFDASMPILMRVWRNSTNTFSWVTDSTLETVTNGFNSFFLTNHISVSNGFTIGFYSDHSTGAVKNPTAIDCVSTGGSARYHELNITDGDLGTATSDLLSLQAFGYAISRYTSRTLDTGNDNPTYDKMSWTIQSNGGSVEMYCRAADTTAALAGAAWYAVTNGNSIPSGLNNYRYFQYRAVIIAATNGSSGPNINDIRVYYDTLSSPEVVVKQSGSTNKPATYVSGSSNGPFKYAYTADTGYDGTATVYATGYDQYANRITNDYVYTFIIDDTIPNISFISCWRSYLHSDPVPNNVASFKEIVSYTWDETNAPSDVNYYYVYDNNPVNNSISITNDSTTNTYLDDFQLTQGTFYFHIRARTGAGQWGNELVFTNICYIPQFLVDIGINSPDNSYVSKDDTDIVAMQLKLTAGSNDAIMVSSITFRATNGTGNDDTGIADNSVRLYNDENGNGVVDGGENLVVNKYLSFTNDNGFVTFDGFTNTIAPNRSTNWLLVYDLSGSANDGDTFVIAVVYSNDIIATDTNASSANVKGPAIFGCTKTIISKGSLTVGPGDNMPNDGEIDDDDKNVSMMQIKFTAAANEDVKIISIEFNAIGSGHDASDLSGGGVALYYDYNENGVKDTGEDLVTASDEYLSDDGSVTFYPNAIVKASSTTNWLLVYNFDGDGTNGSTYKANLYVADISAEGILTELSVPIDGSDVGGANKYIGGDIVPPDFEQGEPFVSPSLNTIVTTVTLKITCGENAYSGGTIMADTNDFSLGTVSDANLSKSSGSLFLTTPSVIAGNSAINRTGNTTQPANVDVTIIDDFNTVNVEGKLTRWEVYVFDAKTDVTLRVWNARNGNNFTYIADSNAETVTNGFNSFNLSPFIDITNGCHIGFYSPTRTTVPKFATAIEAEIAGGAVYFTPTDFTNGLLATTDTHLMSLQAFGYAMSTYTSRTMDTGGSPNYYFMSWDEQLNSGTITFEARAANTTLALASATWYPVQNEEILTNDLNLNRYFQYRVTIEADSSGTSSPVVDNVKVYYDLDKYPIVTVQQSGTNKLLATHISGSNDGPYYYSYDCVSNYDGSATVYASGFDISLNNKTNDNVGSFIIDNSIPNLTWMTCWLSPSHSTPVPNNSPYYDNNVCYTWSDPNSLSDNLFYYELNSIPTNSIDESEPSTTSDPERDGQALSEGTNYFHVRAKTLAGRWGNELIFTNIYVKSSLSLSIGDDSPGDSDVLYNATNIVMMQLKLTTGPVEGVFISNIIFTASGSGDEVNDISSVRLFKDNDNSGSRNAGDTLLTNGTASYTQNNGTVKFTNINQSIGPGSIINWLVVYNFNGQANSGEKFQVTFLSNYDIEARGTSTGDAVTNLSKNLGGCIKNIVIPGTLSLDEINATASSISNDALNVVMLQIEMISSSNENIVIDKIGITNSGTGNGLNDIFANSVRLYLDPEGDGIFDGNEANRIDTSGGETFNINGIVNFSGLAFTNYAGATNHLIVVCSFDGGAADGDTFRIVINHETNVSAVGLSSGADITPTGIPVTGGTFSIGSDFSPPNFVAGAPLTTPISPVRLTNIQIEIDADENAYYSPSAGVTNKYPRIIIVQACGITNYPGHTTGTNDGPYTYTNTVASNCDGIASVYASGFDDFGNSVTNQFVDSFIIDTIPPVLTITSPLDPTGTTNSNINVIGFVSESNTTVFVFNYDSLTNGSLISSISNIVTSGTNFTATNLLLQTPARSTNYITAYAVDAAGNIGTNYAPRIMVIYSNAIIPIPDMQITKSSYVTNTPSFTSIGGGLNTIVPGSQITYTISYTNAGTGPATNFVLKDTLKSYLIFVSNSIYLTNVLQTDGVDAADKSDFNETFPNSVTSTLTIIPAGSSGNLIFKTIVK